ncbi:tetratricopeptide repeat protein [Candidatus Reidiella endopervernicosa]|uniref:Tetratricopeptide repeat protein n=1 Tax=Candidatus Reidiella endopervernicosa TaxID=2738883 RepID=A0A6N0HVP4_9GAMM|nr:tetratricopeptide repeat protein [Candidatus Reidiella endopervernicosa]QKQ26286.1 tetratricopeptide repeat protein [Candidatus Reidiella endopervernicosa]
MSGRKKRLFQPRSLKSQLEPTRSTTAHTKTAVSDAPLPFAGEAPKQRSASEEPLQRAARVATVEVEVNQEISIEQARALADNGDMQAASVCCQQLIDINGSDAEAFYLLATIHQADGDLGGAESLLRKALYLDPGHYEVVVHLATIMERQGDLDASRRFRQRAERLGDRLNSGVSVE